MKNSLGGYSVNWAKQEACNAAEDIFETCNKNLNISIMRQSNPSKYCKLNRHKSENAEEWMGRLRIAITECKY